MMLKFSLKLETLKYYSEKKTKLKSCFIIFFFFMKLNFNKTTI
jgi:hypothetical protein